MSRKLITLLLLAVLGGPLAGGIASASSASRIAASPEYLVLYATEGATAAQSQVLYVSNGGSGTLNFNLSKSTGWFGINSTSGSVGANRTAITVTVNPSGLGSGGSPYIGDITISNADIHQDTKKVRVRLYVLPADAYIHTYQYDARGNLTRRITPNGDIVEYAYDAAGRLTHIYYPSGEEVSYSYDAAGNRTFMTDWHGVTAYTYDRLNRLQSIKYPEISPISYDYDKTGKITKITYPSQDQVSYTYDGDGRLTGVTASSGTTSYQYDNATNNLKKKTLPNGVYTEYGYDTAKRVTDVANKKSDGSIISTYHYIYDANNNITQEVETTTSDTTTKNYTYDKLNRLIRADYSDGAFEAYTYDAMGNRLTKTTNAGVTNYDYDFDNRLLSAGDTHFFYDKSGNLIKKASPQKTEEYQYDYNNLLIQYSSGTDVVQFMYDGNGNRISKIVNDSATNYVNDINQPVVQVIMEADGNWSATKKYVYGLDLISQEEM
jgi:YD repeat-containing protein